MRTPILATKLFIPPHRPNLVNRVRLIERLTEGLRGKLTLISAPAGFGKTTLVSEWVAARNGRATARTAWLSLDARDSTPARFLAYLIGALQTVAADIGSEVLDVLDSPQPPPVEAMLTVLLNEIAAVPDESLLVLDDYHAVDAKAVDDAVAFLLEHLPPQLHVVITTREDPQLPLARLRARGQLTELRAEDLRFTPAEAAAFLNQAMNLDLTADEVDALETRTEGWIAGLQLAALSMQGRTDVSGFIKAFAGDNRYIVDYLVEEVLQRQSESVRDFLLQTAILDRLHGPLCDAVTGQTDGSAVLETLERSNLFVVPLDDTRDWYRYHHLFGDVLYAHLVMEQPDLLPVLHCRASEWHEQNGLLVDAIRHALAAEDVERAAGLIELAWPVMDGQFQSAAWLEWAQALPESLLQTRPVLAVAYAWALLNRGHLERGEAYLSDAERRLADAVETNGEPAPPDGVIIVDDEQFRSLPASIATARAYLAQAHGDVAATMQHARQALDLLPQNDYLRRGIVGALLGLAYWADGELEAAHRTLDEGMINMRRGGNLLFAIRGTYSLADIRLAQGRLRDAISTYEQAIQLASEQGELVMRGTADLHLGLSALYFERNDHQAAMAYLHRSETLGEQDASPHWRYRLRLAQARSKAAQGDLDDALALLDEAARLYVRTPVPDVRPIAAQKARVWIAQGRVAEAVSWAREQGLTTGSRLEYLREFEHITLARALIGAYRHSHDDQTLHEAARLLDRLIAQAEAGQRYGSVIEGLILRALAHAAHEDTPTALADLERALVLAEPEGYVRIFVDEGALMARLLAEAAKRGIAPDYVRVLLAVLETETPVASDSSDLPKAQPLVEPLSERELEVLQLIAEGLSNRAIGERLFLTVSTVKGHNQNIFGKLQVARRTEAVARARELGLL